MKILLLQNNCINNGVTNYWNKRNKKSMENSFISLNKREERETKGAWLIRVQIQNVPYLSIVTTQHKTIQKRVKHLLKKVNSCRHAGV